MKQYQSFRGAILCQETPRFAKLLIIKIVLEEVS